ncbi:MAG: non-homologous end-joining DNA ligase [Phycisphaerae bacterium]|nr:non-homologous end-joining DNA ligase [Phycisphaerae bacterium]
MLAVSSSLPANPSRYSFEFKWDGVRALCFNDGKGFRLQGRNENDITSRYPELAGLARAAGERSFIFDGEVVALDSDNRPSFPLLQQRMHLADPRAIARLMQTLPVLYVIFDLLYLDGHSLMDRPLSERRKTLESLALAGPHWQISPAHVGEGQSMLQTAEDNRLEGVVAKELDSTYAPGRRSPAWLKIKTVLRQEFVVGGYTTGNNGRELGAMLVGYYQGKNFRYAGKVGSGFNQQSLLSMLKTLRPLERETSPFSDPAPGAGLTRGRWTRTGGPIHFVEPKTIVEVEFRRWPDDGSIQQAAFKGVRTDKRPREVIKES